MVDPKHSVSIPVVASKLAEEGGKRYEILSNGSRNSVGEASEHKICMATFDRRFI